MTDPRFTTVTFDLPTDGSLPSSVMMMGKRVVVIDPEDAKEVARLLGFIRPGAMGGLAAFQQALRAMLEPPKPPKPDEPLGLGAVVRDASGRCWVNVYSRGMWQLSEDRNDWCIWADLDAVEVLSEGVRKGVTA